MDDYPEPGSPLPASSGRAEPSPGDALPAEAPLSAAPVAGAAEGLMVAELAPSDPANPYSGGAVAGPVSASLASRWAWGLVDVGATTLLTLSVIVFALIVAAVTLGVAATTDAGPETLRSLGALRAWLDAFALTQRGALVLFLPGQVAFAGAALILAGGAAWLLRGSFREGLALSPGRLPLWTWGLFVLATPLVGWLTSLAASYFIEDPGENMKLIQDVCQGHAASFVPVLLLLIAVMPGVCEELFFRGFVQRRFLGRLPGPLAVLGSSLLFAAAHLEPVHVLLVIPLGVWLGVLAWRSGSLYPSVLCHTANNALAVLSCRYGEDDAPFVVWNLETLLVLSIGVPAMLAALLVLVLAPSE